MKIIVGVLVGLLVFFIVSTICKYYRVDDLIRGLLTGYLMSLSVTCIISIMIRMEDGDNA